MGFKAPPTILQKVLNFKALHHENGKFFIWNNPAFVDPILNQIHYYCLIREACGEEMANKIRYFAGKLQASLGVRIVSQRFGYAKTIPEVQSLEKFNHGQTELLGFGKLENIRMDFKNNIFIHKGTPAFSEEYKRLIGKHTRCVDYWNAGMYSGAYEVYTEKKLVTIETKCVAKGNSYCEFVTKEASKWDKNDPLVKQNVFLFKEDKKWTEIAQKFFNKLGPFK